jgi:hypothetical protein
MQDLLSQVREQLASGGASATIGSKSQNFSPVDAPVSTSSSNKPANVFQIKELHAIHHEIIRLDLLGWKRQDIASYLQVHPATVTNTLEGELGRRERLLLRAARDGETIDVAKEIQRLAPLAISVIEEIMTDPNSDKKLKFNAATDMLDRAGHGAPTKVQGIFAHAYLTPQELDDIKQRALQGGVLSKKEDPTDVSSTSTTTEAGQ